MREETAIPSKRFPFVVHRHGDQAVVTMDCDGLVRARNMPIGLLRDLGDICSAMKAKAKEVLMPDLHVPMFPGYRPLLHCDAGFCQVEFGVHRELDGTILQTVSVYDADDDRAPALLLSGEQIDSFIQQAQGA